MLWPCRPYTLRLRDMHLWAKTIYKFTMKLFVSAQPGSFSQFLGTSVNKRMEIWANQAFFIEV